MRLFIAIEFSCGISLEERRFSPHITLARLKQPVPNDLVSCFIKLSVAGFPVIRVQDFILFQSRLTQQGAVHQPLKRFLLSTD